GDLRGGLVFDDLVVVEARVGRHRGARQGGMGECEQGADGCGERAEAGEANEFHSFLLVSGLSARLAAPATVQASGDVRMTGLFDWGLGEARKDPGGSPTTWDALTRTSPVRLRRSPLWRRKSSGCCGLLTARRTRRSGSRLSKLQDYFPLRLPPPRPGLCVALIPGPASAAIDLDRGDGRAAPVDRLAPPAPSAPPAPPRLPPSHSPS